MEMKNSILRLLQQKGFKPSVKKEAQRMLFKAYVLIAIRLVYLAVHILVDTTYYYPPPISLDKAIEILSTTLYTPLSASGEKSPLTICTTFIKKLSVIIINDYLSS